MLTHIPVCCFNITAWLRWIIIQFCSVFLVHWARWLLWFGTALWVFLLSVPSPCQLMAWWNWWNRCNQTQPKEHKLDYANVIGWWLLLVFAELIRNKINFVLFCCKNKINRLTLQHPFFKHDRNRIVLRSYFLLLLCSTFVIQSVGSWWRCDLRWLVQNHSSLIEWA